IYPPSNMFSSNFHIGSMEKYQEMYKRSIEDSDGFWTEEAEKFIWFKKWDTVQEYNYDIREGSIFIKWFKGGKTNITVNCLDRFLETKGGQTAILWEGNEPGENRSLTYEQLYIKVCRFSNVLKKYGVKKGDRISIYMPMIPELAIAMLACARIGAVHSIVFGGFSSTALADRITDSNCTCLITTDGSFRGSKAVPVKVYADEAIKLAAKDGVEVMTCIVTERVGSKIPT
ncbi:uncharacterized protein METZ01_LOCUS514998, partial [marine metagenome]